MEEYTNFKSKYLRLCATPYRGGGGLLDWLIEKPTKVHPENTENIPDETSSTLNEFISEEYQFHITRQIIDTKTNVRAMIINLKIKRNRNQDILDKVNNWLVKLSNPVSTLTREEEQQYLKLIKVRYVTQKKLDSTMKELKRLQDCFHTLLKYIQTVNDNERLTVMEYNVLKSNLQEIEKTFANVRAGHGR